jgi:hypothetical protein
MQKMNEAVSIEKRAESVVLELKNRLGYLENVDVKEILDGKALVIMIGINDFLDPETGWSSRDLYTQEFLDKNIHLQNVLRIVSESTGTKNFYAPISMKQDGVVLGRGETCDLELNFEDISIYRRSKKDKEGCLIKSSEAFMMAPADCAGVVVENEFGEMFAAHMAKNSQIDVNNPERKSVIENIVNELGGDVSKMKVWIGHGIHFDSYLHDISGTSHAEINAIRNTELSRRYGQFEKNGIKVVRPGFYDLSEVAISEAKRLGVKGKNITSDLTINTGDAEFGYYSNRKSKGRNLFIVVNLS